MGLRRRLSGMKMNSLKNKKIVIVTHVYATGPAQDLEEYLVNRIKIDRLLFIGHPLFYAPRISGSRYKKYTNGKLIKEKSLPNWRMPSAVAYVKDILLTFLWVFLTREKWDLYVGSGGINAFVGIWLRRLGKTKKVVFYTIDYVPKRFENKIINNLYHWVDKFCVKNADQTWNLCHRMAEAREKQKGMKQSDYNKQLTLPIGIWYERIKRLNFDKIQKHTLVFMGHILEKSGVQLVLKAIPDIVNEIKDFKFVIIGSGEYEERLKEITKNLNIEKYVDFKGYVDDHKDLENMLAKCACGVAIYYKEADTFTYYTDPSKVKVYLATGLPVIITDVPYIAREIEGAKCGVIVEYKKEDLVNAIVSLLKNEELLKEYRENATEFARQFDCNKIFLGALGEI